MLQSSSSVLLLHCCIVLQCAAVCCNVLQCAVLQRVAVCAFVLAELFYKKALKI